MPIKRIRQILLDLRQDKSGNAILLTALGAPILIGSAGMAVDMTQWYLWKRELQYAVDQAAIAGAWANSEASTQSSYETRAEQEFSANLSHLRGDAIVPVVGLADYGTGTNNSVTVTASVTRSLPFSQMLIGKPATVAAASQATFEAATNWTVCLLAIDPSADESFIVGGSAAGTVTCGMGAISNASVAISENGNPTVTFNDIIAGGGIESSLSDNGTLHANKNGLKDPYEDISPPESTTPRTYSCPSAHASSTTTTKTADVLEVKTTSYSYWQGKNQSQATTEVQYDGAKAATRETTSAEDQPVNSNTTENSTVQISSESNWTGSTWPVSGSKNEEIYEKRRVVVTRTYTNVTEGGTSTTTDTGSRAVLYPGTYSDIDIACATHFTSGVYVITGTLELGQNKAVTGDDVMFVLSGSGTEKFKLNSNSTVEMSGITKETLVNGYGMDSEAASLLDGMLIYDPNSTSDIQINGGATMILEGTVYMPKRKAKFNGNSAVAGKCMMLAAGTIEFTGSNALSSFCVRTGSDAMDIGGTTARVRLVK